MPFKSLNSPRKATDLGAEVRACALLANAGVVAVLATDPVRLALLPSSGPAKVTNVSLGTAEQVALLSRDVALVRSDDAVWALLGITHTPTMEQVARDARQLCWRPSGDTALVLGWDGGAALLTLNKHEVESRPFALRSTVRACDVGAAETVVVVEGAEGGELRMHPGPTPEPGAVARATLPRDAAKLDQVRGGRDLSVVWARGSRSVCIVHRAGGKLVAKMIQLEAAPACVEVCETSLFVSLEDGRAALYDGPTLAAAGDGALAPTNAVALAARGQPRAMVASGRPSPTLWIGTSEGDVVHLAVARKPPA